MACCCYTAEKDNGMDNDDATELPVVKIAQGALLGSVCKWKDVQYTAFKGIPYAKPPIGELRFCAPQPPEPWEGLREATQHGPVCPQFNERMNRMEPGSEDCLYLNVFTPSSLPPQRSLPVMVWIHGGGYYTGSGNSDFYGPEYFMQQNVVLVTFNYRLEALGFLCLDTAEVPGNAGMKDQVAALSWVKYNIMYFGGNPDNITIFGCSAGGASSSLHMISKMSRGLFNKAICQSGVCLNEWSYSFYGLQRAFQLGKLLGKETEDPKELLEFLRSVPVLSLVNISLPSLESVPPDISDSILFGPVIEKSDLKIEKFLTEPPPDLVRNGQIAPVPIILGYTSGEGIEITRKLMHLIELASLVGYVVPRELKLKVTDMKELQKIDDTIRKYYFGGETITMDKIQEVTDFETDRMFAHNIRRYAKFHARHTKKPVYLYKFCAETERNYTKKHFKMSDVAGVCHADDLHYLFNVTCLDIPSSKESLKIIENIVRWWTNFARIGDPTIGESESWQPITENSLGCYLIDHRSRYVYNEDQDHIKFWDKLYAEFGL